MRIGLLIGGLDTGGAERQLANLAIGLVASGHDVSLAAYTKRGALDRFVEEGGVSLVHCLGGSRVAKINFIRTWMKDFAPQVVHGFMKRASSIAVLAGWRLPCRIVASDYSTASFARLQPVLWGSLLLFGRADAVVTETEMNASNLRRLAPWLRNKVSVIRNGVDIARFAPVTRSGHMSAPFRFVCLGRLGSVKNAVRIVQAVRLLRERGASGFRLDWYGRFGPAGDTSLSLEYIEAQKIVDDGGLNDVVKFHGEQAQVEDVFRGADTLVHAAVQEGIPNAVVEALACGLPLVVSRVSDLPLIVQEANNGFVCDPRDVTSIADAMEKALNVPPAQREAMGQRSRELAVRWFSMDQFVSQHEALYRRLTEPRHS
jgi:glycosyltransferase involved in cell wall biosynthesis